MNREFYSFANRIHIVREDTFGKGRPKNEPLDPLIEKSYQQSVLAAIRRDRHAAKRKYLAAAACIAIVTAALFHTDVQAAISHIRYTLSSAMGLQSSLAGYKETIHTSVCDGGYIVTLEEVAAAPEKLAISYTIRREDGKPMCGYPDAENGQYVNDYPDIEDHLSINGRKFVESKRSAFTFLDEKKLAVGGQISYDITDINLDDENIYDLKFTYDGGSWAFRFKADGSDLYADTKYIQLATGYILPNGTTLTLDTLSINDLEQRITFHASDEAVDQQYAITLHATDEQGRTAVFFLCQSEDGKGYLMNEEGVENGHIAKDAKTVAVTLHVVDFVKIGEETEQGQALKGEQEMIVPPAETAYADGNAVIWDLTES